MGKWIGAAIPVFVAVIVPAAGVNGQTPATAQPQAQQITAVGCITRNGATDIDKGTRMLNMEPNGLALTTARVVGQANNRTTAVPGSVPDNNSGTIPSNTIVGGRGGEQPDTLAFALSGDQVTALGAHVGRRVEIVGRLTEGRRQADTTGTQPRGTSGPDREAAPRAGVGTREERPGERSAHPSAELPRLEVVSFRTAAGPCQ